MPENYASYTKPIVLLAFADPDKDLQNLKVERRYLREIMEQARSKGLCDYIILPDANLTDIARELERAENQNRIAIFHYAGHANSKLLVLVSEEGEKQPTEAKGLAAMLQQQSTLRLIFLNACSTERQVEKMREKMPHANIIATSRAIEDLVAVTFAQEFYSRLGAGAGIQDAYERATQKIKANPHQTNFRKAVLGDNEDIKDEKHEQVPWRLYASHTVEEAQTEETVELSDLDWSVAALRPRRARIVVSLAQWQLKEAIKDPLFGLPCVFTFPRPASPFRAQPFGAAEAGIFAGRERELRKLYDRLTSEDAAPIILLSGQVGVGKSSLLAAGLFPRLASEDSPAAVLMCARSPKAGLLGTLRAALNAEDDTSLAQAWQKFEQQPSDQRSPKPLVVILDKADEVFTKSAPNLSAAKELRACCIELSKTFAADKSGAHRQGKLVLGVRQERLAEISQSLREHQLRYEVITLKPLDYWAIVKAISVAESYYDLTLEQGILSNIADDLWADGESPIAPLLQIILAQMWERVRNEPPEHRIFTRSLYWQVKEQALKKFFDEQLDRLEKIYPSAVESGLALDLLLSHMTPEGALLSRATAELAQEYRHCNTVLPELLQTCKDLYLLTDHYSPSDSAAHTRLMHKSLSPIIWNEYSRSAKPGQRARRVIEYTVAQNRDRQSMRPLSVADLTIVEDGKLGMRGWKFEEQALVAKSYQAKRQKLYLRLALLVTALSLVIVFFYNSSKQKRKKDKENRIEATNKQMREDQLKEEWRKKTINLRDSTLTGILKQLISQPEGTDPGTIYKKSSDLIAGLTGSEESLKKTIEELRNRTKGLDKEKEFESLEPVLRGIAGIRGDESVEVAASAPPVASTTVKGVPNASQAIPTTSPPVSKPLIYLHIQDDEQRQSARTLRKFLKESGFDVPGIEKVGTLKLSTNQVRYFREKDRADANKVVEFLKNYDITAAPSLIGGYEDSTLVKPQQLEVWFTSKPLTLTPASKR